MIDNLEDAIAHCHEKVEELKKLADYLDVPYGMDTSARTDCLECAKDHKQLAEWLTELRHLREVRALLKQKIADTDFDFGDYYDNTQAIINKIFDVIDKVYDEVLYDAKHSKENDNG